MHPEDIPQETLDSIRRNKIGSVPFLNAAPLTFGIESLIEFAPPNQLSELVGSGKLDAALLSVTELLKYPEFELGTEYGICSAGPVLSVFLAHTQNLEEIESIDVDPATCTSIQLLRFILRKLSLTPSLSPMKCPYSEAHKQNNILLIGNPAIDFRLTNKTHKLLDLGEVWTQLTQLPFVYAGWLIRKDLRNSELEHSLNYIAERGIKNLDFIHKNRSDYTEEFRKNYVGKAIYYQLGDKEKHGLDYFLSDYQDQLKKG